MLLDLGLPDLTAWPSSGASAARRPRRSSSCPARDREADKVAALEQGADDYVTKPFGMAELRARIERCCAAPAARGRRRRALRVGDAASTCRHRVTVDDREVHLTPREFEVLKVLLSHAGRLVTHGRLLRAVWGTAYDDEAHYVHVYVSQIRRKLAAADPDGAPRRPHRRRAGRRVTAWSRSVLSAP